MENSIEEDMEIVENYLADSAINETDSDFFKNGGWEIVDLKIPKSMQHILSDYKKLQEEFKQVDYECERLEEKEVRLIKENEKLKSENRKLKVIRYSREYGTENIYLITKSDLVQIDINKYMVEIEDGKFVDLKQIYQENEELKERIREHTLLISPYYVKENFIPVQKVKDKIETLKKIQKEFPNNERLEVKIIAYKELLGKE